MKASKSLLAFALLFAFTALAATADPAPAPALPEADAAAESKPADVFGSSILGNSDCGAPAARAVSGGDPWATCGQCSQNPCKGAAVGDLCGFTGGTAKFCLDYFGGTMCLEEDGVHCRCASTLP